MTTALVASILTALLTLLPARAADWPVWSLPAPLPRPGHGDLVYPAWFEGRWQVSSDGITYEARFQPTGQGVVGDRAFNAEGVGRAVLGDQLLSVDGDPANPNRQIARLAGGLWLESTVVGRRSETAADGFWADELALQVLHGPGEPRVSRVETLSRYQRESGGRIRGEQWQASYPSPALGLAAQPSSSGHYSLLLTPLAQEPEPAPADGRPGLRSDRAS
ncbi:MAG: POLO box duplicated region [Cyanobacteriota bacterium]|nr:POLO box duplicated region [Cyanobacteriota bacterium]